MSPRRDYRAHRSAEDCFPWDVGLFHRLGLHSILGQNTTSEGRGRRRLGGSLDVVSALGVARNAIITAHRNSFVSQIAQDTNAALLAVPAAMHQLGYSNLLPKILNPRQNATAVNNMTLDKTAPPV